MVVWPHVDASSKIFSYILIKQYHIYHFFRGREWTGEYLLDFKDLITTDKPEISSTTEEARFSFIKGGYVEDNCLEGIASTLGFWNDHVN